MFRTNLVPDWVTSNIRDMFDEGFDVKKSPDVKVEDNTVVLLYELPGYGQKDIKINVEDQTVIGVETSDKKRKYSQVRLNSKYDPSKAHAVAKDGLLTVTVPLREGQAGVEIKVHGGK